MPERVIPTKCVIPTEHVILTECVIPLEYVIPTGYVIPSEARNLNPLSISPWIIKGRAKAKVSLEH